MSAAAAKLPTCADDKAWRFVLPRLPSAVAVRAAVCPADKTLICVVVNALRAADVRPFSWLANSARTCVDEKESMTAPPFSALAAAAKADNVTAIMPPMALLEIALICWE